jgi:hypothetical protein
VCVCVCVCVHVLLVFVACLYLLLSWTLSFWLLPIYVGFDCILRLLFIFYILGFSILVTCIWVTIRVFFFFFFIFWFWCHMSLKFLSNICTITYVAKYIFCLYISGHKKNTKIIHIHLETFKNNYR